MSASLRTELGELARRPDLDRLDRSMGVVAIVSEAMEHLNVGPVLVGGMAVLY